MPARGLSYEISVISFNIRSRDDKNGNSIAERAPRLSAITSRYNADIMPDSVGYATMIKHFRDGNTCTANDLGTTYHNYRPKEITTDHIDYCFIDQNIIPLD